MLLPKDDWTISILLNSNVSASVIYNRYQAKRKRLTLRTRAHKW